MKSRVIGLTYEGTKQYVSDWVKKFMQGDYYIKQSYHNDNDGVLRKNEIPYIMYEIKFKTHDIIMTFSDSPTEGKAVFEIEEVNRKKSQTKVIFTRKWFILYPVQEYNHRQKRYPIFIDRKDDFFDALAKREKREYKRMCEEPTWLKFNKQKWHDAMKQIQDEMYKGVNHD